MRSILKTLSWLMVSGLIIFASALYECGSVRLALWAALIASFLKTPVYWLHEVAWSKSGVDPECSDG